jgi:methionine-rich copper-binding protein CopC
MKRLSLLFVSLFFSAFVVSAEAHSAFVRSEPQDRAELKQSPDEIKVWFTEPIRTALSTFELRDSNGKKIELAGVISDEKEKGLVRLTLRDRLAPGTYHVTWTAIAQDLHPGKGSITFRVSP